MRFSKYCDMVENTEQEQQLLQFLKEDEMQTAKQALAKIVRFPFVGKLCAALVALIDTDSLAEFRQSSHYHSIKDFNIDFDYEKRDLDIDPGDEQMAQIKKVLLMIGASFALLLLCRKVFYRKK